jgi:heptaprenyl diphosphate synthase
MIQHAILEPRLLKIANEIVEWARNALTTENPEVKRPYSNNQTVCPFVRESLDKNLFYQAFHPNIGADAGCLESIVVSYIEEFKRLQPFDPNMRFKKALLIVFPDIPDTQLNILDLVHETTKSAFVQSGLMIGQFHQKCDVRGIHNPAFRAAKAPYPLMAIRNMEVHDIVFLSDWKHLDWFAEYNARYGEGFKDPEKFDDKSKALYTYYQRAREAYLRKTPQTALV